MKHQRAASAYKEEQRKKINLEFDKPENSPEEIEVSI